MRKMNKLFVIGSAIVLALSFAAQAQTVRTISYAREDLNNDFIPDHLNDTVIVEGIVTSPNYQTANRSYYIQDATAGIVTYKGGLTSAALALGDKVRVKGTILNYRGLVEIQPLADSNLTVLSSNNTVPTPKILTIAQYKAAPELYEGQLLGFQNVSKVSGTWPAAGSSATLKVSNGTDTIDYRIDSDCDLDGQTEPTWPKDVIVIGSQFSSSTSVNNDGYQVLPRYFATDIVPAGSLPVELGLFTAVVVNNSVILNWNTVTEKNNSGFSVERSSDNVAFNAIGFISGFGTTTEKHQYTYSDNTVSMGKYYYRLKQVDFDGSVSYSKTVLVDVTAPVQFGISQNYPNPFNPSTTIEFSVSSEGQTTLVVYNALGQQVSVLFNQIAKAGNVNRVTFNASNLPSGIYFCELRQGNMSQIKKMALMK